MSRTKKRQPPLPVDPVMRDMILHCKGGKMRHKNERRQKDAGRSWRKEWET